MSIDYDKITIVKDAIRSRTLTHMSFEEVAENKYGKLVMKFKDWTVEKLMLEFNWKEICELDRMFLVILKIKFMKHNDFSYVNILHEKEYGVS